MCQLLSALLLGIGATVALADALMVNRSVSSSNIAQFFVEKEGVRAELEIGLDSLPLFADLMPQGLYEKLREDKVPLEQRLQRFFSRDLSVAADGVVLPGYVRKIGPDKRVLRDPITGAVLPVQADAPDIIRAEFYYPFPEGIKPQMLAFSAPAQAEIGFVVYHLGIAVNDYRYLASGYELTLDWEDPWYSSFSLFQLKRQNWAPMSGFLYIENFEVRKEIIVRPKDLQRWVDLGLAGRDDIPPELQAGIRKTVGEFLARHQPVHIDGEPVVGVLDSVHFLERTLTSSRVIDPPMMLDLDSAIIGAIFSYPIDSLPESVTMDWDLWDEKVQRIPVSAVDEAGPLPSYLEPKWPQLEWENHLTNPTVPAMRQLDIPVAGAQLWLSRLLPLFLVLAVLGVIWLWWSGRRKQSTMPAGIFTLCVAAIGLFAFLHGADNSPRKDKAEAIVTDLLHNIYRSFDYREERSIYDALSTSVTGELLTDIYLETKRSLVLANQGGAEAKVKDVALGSLEVLPVSSSNSFTVKVDWTVLGSVGHWGHIHERNNRYLAELTIVIAEAQWKLAAMTVLQEERL